jgi:hypothetical protein
MRSNTKRQEAASSLEASSYELLNDDSVDSEDGGRTESLASIDGNTPDDMSSIADTEESDDDSFIFENAEPRSHHMASSATPRFGYTSNTDPDTSSLATTRADARSQPPLTLDFVESEWRSEEDDVPSTYLYQTIQGLANMPDLIQQYGSPEIRITFKQSLSKTYMPPKRPFRILFAGEPTDWMREEAVKKIASALAAGRGSISDSSSSSQQSSSRFSVIRVPTESGYSTKVQLIDSTDIELIVTQCVGASRHGTGFAAITTLNLNDAPDLEFAACNFDKGSWLGTIPDIAIFCHPDAPAYQLSHSLEELGQHRLIRDALDSQGIPILDISTVVPFRQCPESYTYGSKSLRLCVEGRDAGEIEFRVLETLPINITSFLDLNPGQLNRHLAHIIHSGSGELSTANALASQKGSAASQGKPGLSSAVRDWLSNVEIPNRSEWADRINNMTTRAWHSRGSLFVAVVVTFSMFAAMLGQKAAIYESLYTKQAVQDAVSSSSISSFAASIPSLWSQAPVTGPTQVPVTAIQTPESHSSNKISTSRVEKSLGLPFTKDLSPKFNDSGEFKIHIIGERHLVLTPPRQFLKLRKPPALFVRVARAGCPVPSSVSKLNQGVFAVELERQHATGTLNVTIWTKSKPVVNQNFTIRFGSPWLKLSAWAYSAGKLSKSVQDDVALAQTSLKAVSSSLAAGLRNGKETVEHGTASIIRQTTSWTKKAKRGSQSVAEHLQEAQREAAQQVALGVRTSKELSQRLQRRLTAGVQVPGKLWRATRPMRASKSVLKARRNSQRLWRKMGLPGLPKEDGLKRHFSGKKTCKKQCRR